MPVTTRLSHPVCPRYARPATPFRGRGIPPFRSSHSRLPKQLHTPHYSHSLQLVRIMCKETSANNVRCSAPGSLSHDPGAPVRCVFCRKHAGPLKPCLALLSGLLAGTDSVAHLERSGCRNASISQNFCVWRQLATTSRPPDRSLNCRSGLAPGRLMQH